MLLDYTVSDVRVIALADQTQTGIVLCICPDELPEMVRDQIVKETLVLLQKSNIVYVMAEYQEVPQEAFIWEEVPDTLSNLEIMYILNRGLQEIKSVIH